MEWKKVANMSNLAINETMPIRKGDHRLNRAQTLLWADHEHRGVIYCLEQGLRGFPNDAPFCKMRGYTIGLILAGQATYFNEAKEALPVGSGRMFQSRPNQARGMKLDRRLPYRDWLLGFSHEIHTILMELNVLPAPDPVWEVQGVEGARMAYRRLFRDLAAAPRMEIADGVIRLCQFFKEIRGASKHPTGGIPESILEAAAARLESLPGRDSVEATLAEFDYPYDRLRKAFAQYHGLTPAQYRIRARITRGCVLLNEGRSVQQTAEQLGYPDPFSFSKQFKLVTGFSPREYRYQT